MIFSRLSCITVVNEYNEYIACISESEIIEACIPAYMKIMDNTAFLPQIDKMSEQLKTILDKPVSEFMDREYPVIKPQDTVIYVADIMNKTSRSILPVVADKRLLGTISRIDLLSIALKEKK